MTIEQFAAARRDLLAQKSEFQTTRTAILADAEARVSELDKEIANINAVLGIEDAPAPKTRTRTAGKGSALATEILAAMRPNVIFTPKQLAATLNKDATGFGVALKQLCDRGDIVRIDHGQYQLADAPEAVEAE